MHLPNPFHLVFRFKLLGYALTFCHPFYQLKKHFLCLPVDFDKMSVQLSACQQIGIKYLAVLSEIPQVSLPHIPIDCSS